MVAMASALPNFLGYLLGKLVYLPPLITGFLQPTIRRLPLTIAYRRPPNGPPVPNSRLRNYLSKKMPRLGLHISSPAQALEYI